MEQRERKRNAARIVVHDPVKVPISLRYDNETISGHVYDFSRNGLSVRVAKGLDLPAPGAELSDISIDAYGEERRLGTAVLKRIMDTPEFSYLGVGLSDEFSDLGFLAERNKAFLQEDESRSLAFYLKYQRSAKDGMKLFAADFAYGLGTYKRALDDVDAKFQGEDASMQSLLFSAVEEGIGLQLKKYMDTMLERLAELVADYSKRDHEQNAFFLRRIVWPFILESEFLKRTNIKPRGYAGDSQMMEMCYNNEYIGNSSFGKILHKHPLESDAAEAVRSRRRLINEELDRYIDESGVDEFTVVSIACGPAWEMEDFFRQSKNRHKLRLLLLDQDREALTEARNRIEAVPTKEKFRVKYLQESVRTLLTTADPGEEYGQFNFVYSMGLFDYLTGPVATAVLSKLYAMTAPGGRLVIGNYHKQNPTRLYMEYLMDWILFYRTEETFLALTEKLPGSFETKIGYDVTGSQMFLNITRTG